MVKNGKEKLQWVRGNMGTLCIAVGMSCCGGGTSSQALTLASIKITTPSLIIGQSHQLSAEGVFADGHQADLTSSVTWSSSNPQVAAVSTSGLLTAMTTGSVAITAQAGSVVSSTPTIAAAYAGVMTYHNDLARTGQNLSETALTPANVNLKQFGKLLSYPVDGAIYAQPLIAMSVPIPNQGVHNVVYVATEHDSVYAFDADGGSSMPLWHDSFVDPASGMLSVYAPAVSNQAFHQSEIGITGTPVIDPDNGTLYVVTYTSEGGGFVYRLHALDITTGAERSGGPVSIEAQVQGAGAGGDGEGHIAFNPQMHLQRMGLALAGGSVYVGFASQADTAPWHGWLLAFDSSTLAQVASYNATPDGYGGGIWQAGGAPAIDADGSVYLASGNGTFDAPSSGADFGDSVLKLQARSLQLLDWFTPFNQSLMGDQDLDLGSGGIMLLPDQTGAHPQMLVLAGKFSSIYLLDRTNLGHFNAGSDNVVQRLDSQTGQMFSTPAYWQGHVYFAGWNDNLKMFSILGGVLSDEPSSSSSNTFGFAGATPSISAQGAANGIVWTVDYSQSGVEGAAVLYAFDATDVSKLLYASNELPRDQLGPAAKFSVPTVYNGKVYVGTATELDILGLIAN